MASCTKLTVEVVGHRDVPQLDVFAPLLLENSMMMVTKSFRMIERSGCESSDVAGQRGPVR